MSSRSKPALIHSLFQVWDILGGKKVKKYYCLSAMLRITNKNDRESWKFRVPKKKKE